MLLYCVHWITSLPLPPRRQQERPCVVMICDSRYICIGVGLMEGINNAVHPNTVYPATDWYPKYIIQSILNQVITASILPTNQHSRRYQLLVRFKPV